MRVSIFLSRLLFVLALAAVVVAAGSCGSGRKRDTRYVAYVGRYTNIKDSVPIERQQRNKFDLMHETALRDYLAELSDSLGTVELELKTFDNHRDARTSDSLYRNVLARDSDIVLVIDNTWGEHIGPCAEAIRSAGIPVISMNADRNDHDFGPTALFTGNDDDVPGDIAAYLTRVLGADRVNMVTETDYALHPVFTRELAGHGVAIGRMFAIEGKPAITPERERGLFDSLRLFYRAHPEELGTILLINTHNTWGERLLTFIEKEIEGLTVISGAYIAARGAIDNFSRGGHNQMIVMSRPTDALPKEIHNRLVRYRALHPDYFDSPSAQFFMKRCLSVTEIIAGGLPRGDSVIPDRRAFADYFRGLAGRAIIGAHDLYEFDSGHVLRKDIYFTKNRGGKLYSLPTQLNRQRDLIPNVFFGVDILDIYDIDVNDNTFKSDFFYWVKVDTAFRDAERYVVFRNLKQNESSRELVVEKTDEETIYRLYKVSGVFHHNYELRDFPFDEQELGIDVEILKPADRLKISFDQSSFDQDTNIFERFTVPAWNKLSYYVTVDNRITSVLRGDPEQTDNRPTVFKNFSFRLRVERKFLGPFLEIVLPLTLIGFVAIALLYVKDISFENLGEVSVGTFLGIITFSIALSYATPSSDNLTRADFLFWITFVVVLTSFLTVIIVNSRHDLESLQGVSIKPITWAITLLYPLAILAVLLL